MQLACVFSSRPLPATSSAESKPGAPRVIRRFIQWI
jgi:hypothetical protein